MLGSDEVGLNEKQPSYSDVQVHDSLRANDSHRGKALSRGMGYESDCVESRVLEPEPSKSFERMSKNRFDQLIDKSDGGNTHREHIETRNNAPNNRLDQETKVNSNFNFTEKVENRFTVSYDHEDDVSPAVHLHLDDESKMI